MGQFEIPFLPEFQEAMLSGRKTVTSRTKKYGEPGDWFEVFGAEFHLIKVFKATLNQIAFLGWYSEGLSSPGDFVGVWNR